MRQLVLALFVAAIAVSAHGAVNPTASDLAYDIYRTCLKDFSTSCIKPKALAWVSNAVAQDKISITDTLSIVKTGDEEPIDVNEQRGPRNAQVELFDKVDRFLATHALKVEAPAFLKTNEARSMIPSSYLQGGLAEGVEVPLSGGNVTEGRGFVRKVILPFLIGLKLKTTVLVPLALALIALKTWKAMTLGLLSLVLSGALVIFKIVKPKIVNYEVVHYPHHSLEHYEHAIPHHFDHHFDHPVEHIVPHHADISHHAEHIEHFPHHVEHVDHIAEHIEHVPHFIEHAEPPAPWDPQPWSRSSDDQADAQDMAYNGQRN